MIHLLSRLGPSSQRRSLWSKCITSSTSSSSNAWFEGGLTFACTKCGRCCKTPVQRQVSVNSAEKDAIAAHLGISQTKFEKTYIDSENRLQTRHGTCVFLRADNEQRLCSIWAVRPTQCATYPFWSANIASPIDWRATAAQCEGINLSSRSSPHRKQDPTEAGVSDEVDYNAISSPHAGQPSALDYKSQDQVIRAAVLTDVHESGDVDGTATELDELLSTSVNEDAWKEAVLSFNGSARTLVFAAGDLEVVDSCIAGEWQRDVIHLGSPAHTQSCLPLVTHADALREVVHTHFPPCVPVFQALAAAPLLSLRLRPPSAAPQEPSEPHQAIRTAVVGAGAGAIPAVWSHYHSEMAITAVDNDAGILDVGARFMGAKASPHLTLKHQDGLDFIAQLPAASLDVLVLDVAAMGQMQVTGSRGEDVANMHKVLLSPLPPFLGPACLDGPAFAALAPGGLLAVHCIGPADHQLSTLGVLERHAVVTVMEVGESKVMFARVVDGRDGCSQCHITVDDMALLAEEWPYLSDLEHFQKDADRYFILSTP